MSNQTLSSSRMLSSNRQAMPRTHLLIIQSNLVPSSKIMLRTLSRTQIRKIKVTLNKSKIQIQREPKAMDLMKSLFSNQTVKVLNSKVVLKMGKALSTTNKLLTNNLRCKINNSSSPLMTNKPINQEMTPIKHFRMISL